MRGDEIVWQHIPAKRRNTWRDRICRIGAFSRDGVRELPMENLTAAEGADHLRKSEL
jgi:hypothetical protein